MLKIDIIDGSDKTKLSNYRKMLQPQNNIISYSVISDNRDAILIQIPARPEAL